MKKILHLFMVMLLSVSLLSACGNTGGDGSTEQASLGELLKDEDSGCPPIKDPVCAELDGEKMTFANACEAGAAGSEAWERGEC